MMMMVMMMIAMMMTIIYNDDDDDDDDDSDNDDDDNDDDDGDDDDDGSKGNVICYWVLSQSMMNVKANQGNRHQILHWCVSCPEGWQDELRLLPVLPDILFSLECRC